MSKLESSLANRRQFMQFMGGGALALASGRPINISSRSTQRSTSSIGIAPSTLDDVVLAKGLESRLLISWNDIINKKGDRFGFNNDYIAILSLSKEELLMWVNHESANPIFVSHNLGKGPSKARVDKELYNVGGALLALRKKGPHWVVDTNSPHNRRLTGHTPIPFDHGPIAGSKIAMGTIANCAGGVTPWKTILTCEENYDHMYGELSFQGHFKKSSHGWENFYPNSPLHYGWVVEVEPLTGKATKRVSLGRFRHESATCHPLSDGRVVIYSGEDKEDEHLYKFISKRPRDLSTGELFVLKVSDGKWISLDREKQPLLQKNFKDQQQVFTFTRDAAKMLKATPLDRPEDIAIHPHTKDVYVCLTNNKKWLRPYGSMLKLSYPKQNHESHEVHVETFKTGGHETAMTCPDNIVFDAKGNLWFTNDIHSRWIEKGPYKGFGHNGLFLIPAHGPHQGQVIQMASAPKEAEFTGPCFSPDGKTLFLSVQHPGELTQTPSRPTGRWPGPDPRPSVIQISGPLLEHKSLF